MEGNKNAKSYLKDIAENLGISPGTVSIVLNGRGDSMRISKATQKKVQDLAREMNYQPNIYARRLRVATEEGAPLVISVFWRRDNLDVQLAKFLAGIHNEIKKRDCRAELMVQPYEIGCIQEYTYLLNSNRFSGAMIVGLSVEEQECLEAQEFNIPIILIGRDTRKFHCVLMDDYWAGEKCAKLIDAGNTVAAASISTRTEGKGSKLIGFGFHMGCRERGMESREEWSLKVDELDYENGYQAAMQLLDSVPQPCVWLVMSSKLAAGVMAACTERNVRIPEDLKLIFFQDTEMLKYHKPSLAAVDIPFEKMGEKALDILLVTNENRIEIPIKRELVPIYYLRESIGTIRKETFADLDRKEVE